MVRDSQHKNGGFWSHVFTIPNIASVLVGLVVFWLIADNWRSSGGTAGAAVIGANSSFNGGLSGVCSTALCGGASPTTLLGQHWGGFVGQGANAAGAVAGTYGLNESAAPSTRGISGSYFGLKGPPQF